MEKRKNYVTGRDRRILKFVDRYRAATADMLTAEFLPDAKDGMTALTNIQRILRRLKRQGFIEMRTFAPGCTYVVLTRRGCRVIDMPAVGPRPFTEQSLPVALGIAWYCVDNELTRLTDREFRTRFPELAKPGMRSSCYYLVETTSGLQLGVFLVDRGGSARRTKRKIRRVIIQRQELPAFKTLMNAGRFRVTILTGAPAQQQNLRRHLRRRSFAPVHIDVALVSELGELLMLT